MCPLAGLGPEEGAGDLLGVEAPTHTNKGISYHTVNVTGETLVLNQSFPSIK